MNRYITLLIVALCVSVMISSFTSCSKKNNPKPVVVDSLKVGLVAYYPFNNNAIDSSGKGNDGTVYNITSAPNRFGKANTAYYFNGTSSYIRVKDNQALRLSNTDFTINYWVNLDDYIVYSGSAVLAKANGPYQNGWNTSITGYGSVGGEGGGPGFAFYNVSGGGDPFAVGHGIIPIGQWTMITVQYSNQFKALAFYINGVPDAVISNLPTPNPATAVDLFIGKNSYNDPSGNTPGYFIKGKLDDIRIYNRVISPGQINNLFKLTY
ncbi:LamG domain-containing protein [Mucilaginibacter sp. RCC_168]|uniref:LamG domain-containing protein n=1 Tax=Mucilaginibacter sp. RCC_168 TaxID=3239221 RepID=UPI003525D129